MPDRPSRAGPPGAWRGGDRAVPLVARAWRKAGRPGRTRAGRWRRQAPGGCATRAHVPIKVRIEEQGTWRCPTPLHRARLLEMEATLASPRALLYGSLAVAFLVAIPWIGVWPIVLLAAAALLYRPVTRGLPPARAPSTSWPPPWSRADPARRRHRAHRRPAQSGHSGAAAAAGHPPRTLLQPRRPRRVRGPVAVLLASTVALDPSGLRRTRRSRWSAWRSPSA
jgi:hypothetical protein